MLPDICIIPITDGTHQTPKYTTREDGIPFLSSKDVTKRFIDWSSIKYITRDLHDVLYSRIAPQKFDILLAKNGTTGVAAMVEDDRVFDIYVTLAVIRPAMPYIHPNYLLHIINSHFCKSQFNSHLTGIGLPNLHLTDINKTYIPLPPYNEQCRIVEKLENLLSVVDNIENCNSDIRESIQSAKSKVLDLAIHGKLVPQDANDEPASDLLRRINPKAVASCDNPHYENVPNGWIMLKGKYLFESMKSTKPTEEFFKYIDIDSIDNRIGIVTAPKVLPSQNAPSRASRYTCKGDVLFSMVRPYLRNIAIVPENNCIASTGFFVCHPIPVMTAEFCYFLMKSSYIVDGLNQFMKGDNSPSINNANITDWIYPIPPLEEQNRIVKKIKKLYGTIDCIAEALL